MVIDFVRFTVIHKTHVHLLTLFVRDGTVFYAVIFATLLTQVLLYELVNSALAQIAIAWQLTVFSIAGSRLILNLRVNAAKPFVETFEMTGTRMRFDNSMATSLNEPSYNDSSEQTLAFERSRTSSASEKPASPTSRHLKCETVQVLADVTRSRMSANAAAVSFKFAEGQEPHARNDVRKSD